jgi:hypothetical protein
MGHTPKKGIEEEEGGGDEKIDGSHTTTNITKSVTYLVLG